MRRMRQMRRVGAAVVVAGMLGWAVAGCGVDGGGGAGTSGATSASATGDGGLGVDGYEPDTPPPHISDGPQGPRGDIDRKADAEGWTYDELYDSASAFVDDVCVSLPESGVASSSRPQWLVESGMLAGDGAAILRFGVPKLCPQWKAALAQAVSGRYDRWLTDGDWEVAVDPVPLDTSGGSDVQEAAPGTYRISGNLADCYWERTSRSGGIIANQMASQARTITVTLEVGELFRSQGCSGVWKPVR